MSTYPQADGALLKVNMDAKYKGLMEDYFWVEKDYAELKDRVQAANKKKAFLAAEVRFLRRKLKMFKDMPSEIKVNQTVQISSQSALQNCDGKTNPQTPVTPTSVLSAKNDWSPMFLDPLQRNTSGCLKPIVGNIELLSSQKISSVSDIHNSNVTERAKKTKPSSVSNTNNPNLTAPEKKRKQSSLTPDKTGAKKKNPSSLRKILDLNLTAPEKRRKPSSVGKTPDPSVTAPAKMENPFLLIPRSDPSLATPANRKTVTWLDQIYKVCD